MLNDKWSWNSNAGLTIGSALAAPTKPAITAGPSTVIGAMMSRATCAGVTDCASTARNAIHFADGIEGELYFAT